MISGAVRFLRVVSALFLATSFIAYFRQGIHHAPLVT
jgi:hypothetical protein